MNWAEVGRVFGRALLLRCPVCGKGRMFHSWFKMNEECARCGWHFEREEGYFTGAMAINLVLAELVLCVAAIAFIVNGTPIAVAIPAGVALGVALPMLGWPFSRSLWVALDLILHPLSE